MLSQAGNCTNTMPPPPLVLSTSAAIHTHPQPQQTQQSVRVILGGGLDDSSSSAGTSYPARVVGTDAMHDLAVLQVKRAGVCVNCRVAFVVFSVGQSAVKLPSSQVGAAQSNSRVEPGK